uniref:RNA helicase n=1 Tax=Daphnia galeata TaxID=27404 RepID=A0A8J2RLS6_9CRUS|nr:unnamed protein product [Daphnia galeata]
MFPKPNTDVSDWKEERPDFNSDESTNFVYNPHRSQSIENQRKRLPIFENRDQVLYLLEKHQFLILIGETGSGKSTQVPQYLLESGWGCDGKVIAVTQPRRVAALSLAARVADEIGTSLGQMVGYSIRFDEQISDKTRLKFVTDGMLLREMLTDPLLKKYCVIMVDEVHERSLNTDILLSLLKKICKKRPELRLVISSATLDAEELKNYFALNKDNKSCSDRCIQAHYQVGSAVVMNVVGRCYPVDIFYVQDPVSDYLKASVDTVIKISIHEPSGDVLVFLTGFEEVEAVVRLLKEYANTIADTTNKDKLSVLAMHGGLSNEDQLQVFQRPSLGRRKIVVATNVAEASITIPGIVYVIDCGFVKLKWFNADTQTDALVVVPISQASAQQRAGRAGRIRAGKVYRLYTEDYFYTLNRFTPPEVQRSNLSPAVLQLKALGVDDVIHFDFPSPPPAQHLAVALELLFALKAIDTTGRLTDAGLKIAEFPVEPIMGKMLLSSKDFKCSKEIVSIVAAMQVQALFYYPTRGQESIKARTARRKFEAHEGDLITYLNVVTAFAKHGECSRWCQSNYLNKKSLKRVVVLRNQLIKLLRRLDIPISSAEGELQPILRCIASSFFPNTAYLHPSGQYKTVLADIVLQVHPHSILFAEEKAPWVVFGEVLQTTQLFMRDITVIDPTWLEELAPHYFQKVTER